MYCNVENECKKLKYATSQYEKVVEQNRNLQSDSRKVKQELKKYKKVTITLLESFYVTFGDCMDKDLKREVEEFLMINKD